MLLWHSVQVLANWWVDIRGWKDVMWFWSCRLKTCWKLGIRQLHWRKKQSDRTTVVYVDCVGVEPHRPWGVDGHGESPMAGRGIGVWRFSGCVKNHLGWDPKWLTPSMIRNLIMFQDLLVGLPLCRLYAMYLGASLHLMIHGKIWAHSPQRWGESQGEGNKVFIWDHKRRWILTVILHSFVPMCIHSYFREYLSTTIYLYMTMRLID